MMEKYRIEHQDPIDYSSDFVLYRYHPGGYASVHNRLLFINNQWMSRNRSGSREENDLTGAFDISPGNLSLTPYESKVYPEYCQDIP